MQIRQKDTSYPTKRNREVLSCIECHRRKQKCNRRLPCNDCSLRGVPQKCAYKTHVSTQQPTKIPGSTNRTWKRIANGTEVLLSAESVADLIVSSGTDPFSSLPGGLDDETRLVHHYNTIFINTRHAPGAREQWFPMALKDPAFYHSIMMVSAANIAGLLEKPVTPSFWYHRGEAIEQINTRLVNNGRADTDLCIATIAVLCLVDCLELVINGVRAHQMALKRLVVRRGGLKKLGMSIQKLLGWTDLLVSLALVEPPALQQGGLSAAQHSTYYGTPSLSTVSYATDLKARLFYLTNQRQLSDSLARIYWGLRNISILTTTASVGDSLSGLYFSDRCEFLEREVQELLHGSFHATTQESDNHSLIFTLFARASLIYIYSDLRELLINVKLFQEVGSTLEGNLNIKDHHLNIFLGLFPELMLWVALMGRSALPRNVSFTRIIAKILMSSKTENIIQNAATGFLWPEGRENYDSSTIHGAIHAESPGPEISRTNFSVAVVDSSQLTKDINSDPDYNS